MFYDVFVSNDLASEITLLQDITPYGFSLGFFFVIESSAHQISSLTSRVVLVNTSSLHCRVSASALLFCSTFGTVLYYVNVV